MSREGNLVKNTAILGVGAIVSKGLVFLMIPFFSRWLSTDDYGYFDVFSSYITLLIPFMTLSSGEAIFRFLLDAREDTERKSIVTNGLLIFAVGNTITIAVAMLFFINTQQNMAGPFCFFLFSEALYQFSLTYLRGIRKLTYYTVCNIMSTVGIVVFVTLLVKICNFGLSGMLYGYGLGYLVSSLIALSITKFHHYLSLSTSSAKEVKALVKYSAPLIPNAISWWVINASDRSIINLFLGATANGIYGIAYKVPSLCTTLFSVFNASWQENVASAINDADREKYFSQIFSNMIKVLVSICICIISVDFILFGYVFDIKYYEGMQYVPILITSCIFTVVSQFYGGIFIGLKIPKYNGSTSVMAAVINVAMHLILVKPLGLYAAAVSTIISFIALCVVRHIIISKQFSFSIEKKNLLYVLLYLYYVITHYVNNPILNWANIAIAIACFLAINKSFIMKAMHKVKGVLSK